MARLGLWGKFCLLMWKNYRFRCRHWIVSVVEIFLPCLIFAGLAIYLWHDDKSILNAIEEPFHDAFNPPKRSSKNSFNFKNDWEESNQKQYCHAFEACTESNLIKYLADELIHNRLVENAKIGYAPGNNVTRKVMLKMMGMIKSYLVGSSDPHLYLKEYPNELVLESLNIEGLVNVSKAIVFQEGFDGPEFPSSKKLSYKIRFTQVAHGSYDLTKYNVDENELIFRGYPALQLVMDKTIIQLLTEYRGRQNHNLPPVTLIQGMVPGPSNETKSKDPRGLFEERLELFSIIYASLFAISFLPIVPITISGIVGENQEGGKELTFMMGMSKPLYMVTWLVDAFIRSALSTTAVVFLLFLPVVPRHNRLLGEGDPTLVWVTILVFVMATVSWAFLFSAPFNKPTVPVITASIAWLFTFLFAAWGQRRKGELPTYQEAIECLLVPPLAIRYAFRIAIFLTIVKPEGQDFFTDYGVTWSNIHVLVPGDKLGKVAFGGKSGMCLGHTILLMVGCSIIYCSLGLYIECIVPSNYGLAKPWYFPITCLFYKVVQGKRTKPTGSPVNPVPAAAAAGVIDEKSFKSGTTAPSSINAQRMGSYTHTQSGNTIQSKSNLPVPLRKHPETRAQMKQLSFSSSSAEVGGGSIASGSGSVTKESKNEETNESRNSLNAEFDQTTPAIEIFHLTKTYGNEVVVNDVTCTIFDGQIMSLLGHNGAGKTTTISMITGLRSPTRGMIRIHGFDVASQYSNAMESTALCPQHNVRFGFLTVLEHLIFFARLKGSRQPRKDAERMIRISGLVEKKNTLSSALSGGQMRKLNLAMALIAGTKVVILDEPLSGMDPQSRREVCDLLLSEKSGRAILISTHFMEEADALSDRVGIMFSGRLVCWGTPMFLKNAYAPGYILTLALENPKISPEILKETQRIIKGATVREGITFNDHSFRISLPSDTTSQFPELFSVLEGNTELWGITSFGISIASMDDVFISVVDEESRFVRKSLAESKPLARLLTNDKISDRLVGKSLVASQIKGLVIKRGLYTYNKWLIVIFQLLLAILPMVIFSYTENIYPRYFQDPYEPLLTTMAQFKDPVTPYQECPSGVGKAYAKVVGSSAKLIDDFGSWLHRSIPFTPGPMGWKHTVPVPISEFDTSSRTHEPHRQSRCPSHGQVVAAFAQYFNIFPASGTSYIEEYRRVKIAAAIIAEHSNYFPSNFIISFFSSLDNNTMTLSLNTVSNAMLEKLLLPDTGYRIETMNHPLRKSKYHIFDRVDAENEMINAVLFAIFMSLSLCLSLSMFYVVPAEERQSGVKQIQLMTGVNPLYYWLTFFVWDFISSMILVGVIIVVFHIASTENIYISGVGAGVLALIGAVYAYAGIHFCYLWTFVPISPIKGFSWLLVLHIIMGILFGLASYIFRRFAPSFSSPISPIFRIFPSYVLTLCLAQFAENAVARDFCRYPLREPTHCALLQLYKPTSLFTRRCCEPTNPPSRLVPDLTWELYNNGKGYHDDMVPNVGQEMLWMFLVGIGYQVLLYTVELFIVPQWRQRRSVKGIFTSNKPERKHSLLNLALRAAVKDDNVRFETERVDEIVRTERISEEAIVVQNLGKKFGKHLAVGGINFGVHRGECFGLVGVNGAGKTTSFRILTGGLTATTGNAWIGEFSMHHNPLRFLSSIGYCPQFDCVISVFTGRQMLQLMARLRGLKYVSDSVDLSLLRLGLHGAGRLRSQNYSGGMRRRLSAGVALIGEPSVVLLDEPSSGVDPVARRQLWEILNAVKGSGSAIILTSHSVDECESLCSRIAIMVAGQFQCMGHAELLKHKYTQGFKFSIKLNPHIQREQLQALEEKILQVFDPCVLRDQNETLLVYNIQALKMPWKTLFALAEEIKREFPEVIKEYSVRNTSFEDVFLGFATNRFQRDSETVS